jgi:hypothetical protein
MLEDETYIMRRPAAFDIVTPKTLDKTREVRRGG